MALTSVPDQTAEAPLYTIVARALMRDIMAGRLADGARLPPEREMAAEMGIAVGTLRRALAELAERDLLDRRQGSGNYIKAGAEIAGIYSFFRLEKSEGGGMPSAEVLGLARCAKPADAPAFGPDPEGQRLRRLRLLDDVPVALEEIWFDAGRVPDLTEEVRAAPLYHALRTRLGLWITRAEDRVGLGHVPDWAPDDFAPATGAACPLVERIGRAQDGEAVEYSRTWIDAERARYVQRLT
ncbi:MAG: GntR family transcriptional regulator [Pseudomonadota bacterium]